MKKLSAATIGLYYGGDHTTVELYATDSLSSSADLSGMKKIATVKTSGRSAKLTTKQPVETRYVLVWLTAMPNSPADNFSQSGYKQAITDVRFEGQ